MMVAGTIPTQHKSDWRITVIIFIIIIIIIIILIIIIIMIIIIVSVFVFVIFVVLVVLVSFVVTTMNSFNDYDFSLRTCNHYFHFDDDFSASSSSLWLLVSILSSMFITSIN